MVTAMHRAGLAVLITFMAGLGFAQAPICQGGMVGLDCPPILDTNFNGMPDAGDTPLTFPADGCNGTQMALQFNSPWRCGPYQGPEWIGLNDLDGDGKADQAEPYLGHHVFVTIDNASLVGGAPTGFDFEERSWVDDSLVSSGRGDLVDSDGNGYFDRITGSGTNATFDLGFVTYPAEPPYHYISIPWSLANLAGVQFGDNCPVGMQDDPQVWFPLYDTDGNNSPDSIVPDIMPAQGTTCVSDGVPDQQLYPSPRLEPGDQTQQVRAIPALTDWGLVLLLAIIAGIGWVVIRRSRVLA
jgi:hypothetical protein